MRKKFVIVLTIFLISMGSAQLFSSPDKAAIINLDGAITPGSAGAFSSDSITPSEVREHNEQAKRQGASAIIYEWNSGGGAVVASKEIKRELESVSVPTVCRFRDVAASGAYYASLGCDEIVADSSSITGSIGVRSSYLEFSGTLDKAGIDYVNITSGNLKDIGSQYRNATSREIDILKNKTDKIHNSFVEDVVGSRNLSEEQREEIQTGEIFLGDRAKRLGLVDSLGGRDTAVRSAENLTEKELETFRIESSSSFNILSLLGSSSIASSFFDSGSPIEAKWN